MLPPPRLRFLLGLALGFLLAAALVALLGPSLPAGAQSARSPTLEPFRADGRAVLELPTSDGRVDLLPPVPAGKLLVVEAVFTRIGVSAGARPFLQVGAPEGELPVPITASGPLGPGDSYIQAASPTRLYVPAGPVRAVLSSLTAGADAVADINVVGHLIPAP